MFSVPYLSFVGSVQEGYMYYRQICHHRKMLQHSSPVHFLYCSLICWSLYFDFLPVLLPPVLLDLVRVLNLLISKSVIATPFKALTRLKITYACPLANKYF